MNNDLISRKEVLKEIKKIYQHELMISNFHGDSVTYLTYLHSLGMTL